MTLLAAHLLGLAPAVLFLSSTTLAALIAHHRDAISSAFASWWAWVAELASITKECLCQEETVLPPKLEGSLRKTMDEAAALLDEAFDSARKGSSLAATADSLKETMDALFASKDKWKEWEK